MYILYITADPFSFSRILILDPLLMVKVKEGLLSWFKETNAGCTGDGMLNTISKHVHNVRLK